MIRVLIAFLILLLVLQQRVETAYNPFTPEVIKVTNTALANANITPAIEFNNINTTAVVNTDSNADVFTSVTTNGVVCAPGTYLVDVMMYATGGTRTNVSVEVTVDSVGTGIIGASGYRRNSDGHQEATSIVHDTVNITSSSKIGFDIERLANAGTVAVPVGQSIMRITRMKD